MNDWNEVFTGSIWLVEQQQKPDGRIFERARRTPGVRVLVVDNNRLLLNKERRSEIGNSFDWRLPGGKVFDDIHDWQKASSSEQQMLTAARAAALSELHEECGLRSDMASLRFIAKDINGGKSQWDLYYFLLEDFTADPNGPAFSGDESSEIVGYQWFEPSLARAQALDIYNGMSESRSARYVAAWADGLL